VNATANVVIIAAIISKVGPSTMLSGIRPPRPAAVFARNGDYVSHARELVGQASGHRGHVHGFVDAYQLHQTV
jgi:hypothetical protein